MDFKLKNIVVFGLLFLVNFQAFSQELSGKFTKEIITNISLNYILQLPENQKEKMPLLVFLHGSGERGTDLNLVKNHSPFTYQNLIQTEVAILAPQCPANEYWDKNAVYELINFVVKKYNIDPSRIYLTGLSMGGWGVWKLASEHPELFAAIAPVCGLTDRNILARTAVLNNMPIQIFHGALDDVVPANMSIEIFQKLKKVNPNCNLTIFPNDNHNSWDSTYSNSKFYEWLFAQKNE